MTSLAAPAAALAAGPPAGAAPDFRRLLGEAAWQRLPGAVRARFAISHAAGQVTCYAGQMRVHRSGWGWLLAQACRVLGSPLAPQRGDAVPTRVLVYADPNGGVVWERRYRFGRRETVIRSSKRLDSDGLVECLAAGLRMYLDVYESAGRLHFASTGYALQLGRWRITLPRWLTPGLCHVVHTDTGGGQFRFAMRIVHPLLGELFDQEGLFVDPQEPR